MKLRTKIFFIFLLTSAVVCGSAFVSYRYIVLEDVSRLEQESMKQKLTYASEIVFSRADQLVLLAHAAEKQIDFSEFLRKKEFSRMEGYFLDTHFQSRIQSDVFIVVSREGEILHASYERGGRIFPFTETLSDLGSLLDTEKFSDGAEHKGIVRTLEGNMLLAEYPVFDSENRFSGTFLLGKFFDNEFYEYVHSVAQLPATLLGYSDPVLPGDFERAKNRLNDDVVFFIEQTSENSLSGYATLADMSGNPSMLLKLEMPRELFLQEKENLRLLAWTLFGVFFSYALVTGIVAYFLVVRKLLRLNEEIIRVMHANDIEERVSFQDSGEFGVLAKILNQLLENIQYLTGLSRQNERRFESIADLAPVMIWMTDFRGRYVYVNRSWSQFTGIGLDTLRNKESLPNIHPEDEPGRNKIFQEACLEKKSFQYEYRLKRFDGEYRWVLETGNPNFAKDKSLLGYLGSVVDITERRAAEEAVLRHTQEIEEMNQMMVARELHMMTLKEEIKRLKKEKHG